MKTIWFDITNTPHVHFFKPIMDRYTGRVNSIVSVRDYSEAVELALKSFRLQPNVIGGHGGGYRVRKVVKLLSRLNVLRTKIAGFDYALSCGGFESCILAKLGRKVSIVFDDNDLSPNWMYARIADHVFFPAAVKVDVLRKQGFNGLKLHQYEGYKEDIYVANYEPDNNFLLNLPYSDYVVVRPENVMASYSGKRTRTIVPELLRSLSRQKVNVLYLPRASNEHCYAYGIDRVFIPRKPLNGLDVCFFSTAVLSGAGSLTREAACLGKPAVSFYAGKRFLAVDLKMMKDKWLFHSRSPDDIIEYLRHARPRVFERERAKRVQNAFFAILDRIILR